MKILYDALEHASVSSIDLHERLKDSISTTGTVYVGPLTGRSEIPRAECMAWALCSIGIAFNRELLSSADNLAFSAIIQRATETYARKVQGCDRINRLLTDHVIGL